MIYKHKNVTIDLQYICGYEDMGSFVDSKNPLFPSPHQVKLYLTSGHSLIMYLDKYEFEAFVKTWEEEKKK